MLSVPIADRQEQFRFHLDGALPQRAHRLFERGEIAAIDPADDLGRGGPDPSKDQHGFLELGFGYLLERVLERVRRDPPAVAHLHELDRLVFAVVGRVGRDGSLRGPLGDRGGLLRFERRLHLGEVPLAEAVVECLVNLEHADVVVAVRNESLLLLGLGVEESHSSAQVDRLDRRKLVVVFDQ